MKIAITITLDEDTAAEYGDPSHSSGLTNEAHERLTTYTEHGGPPLLWLGEVDDIELVDADAETVPHVGGGKKPGR